MTVKLTREQIEEAISLSASKYKPKRLDYVALKEAANSLLQIYYCVPVDREHVAKFWTNIRPCHSKKKFVDACRLVRTTCRQLVRKECERKDKRKECRHAQEGTPEVLREESTTVDTQGSDIRSGDVEHPSPA